MLFIGDSISVFWNFGKAIKNRKGTYKRGKYKPKKKRKMGRETAIDLGKLFQALLRRLPIILLVTLCFAAIGFSYAKYYLPLQYTASTYMYVKMAIVLKKRKPSTNRI